MHKKAKPYLFLLPAFFFLFIFTLYPIAVAFKTSFFKINLSNPGGSFNGIQNYLNLLGDRTFGVVLKNSLIYALSTIAIGFAFSLLLALLLDMKIRFASVYKVSLFYPTMIPMARRMEELSSTIRTRAGAMLPDLLSTNGKKILRFSRLSSMLNIRLLKKR